MKRLMSAILTVLMILSLCACGQSGPTWQEQYDLGIKYLEDGNYQEAILAFTAAIEIDPKQPDAYVGRGDAYVFSGETEDNLAAAQADYEEAIALDETNANAYLGLADVYIRRGDYDAALELLKAALEKTGNDQSVADKIAEIESGSITDRSGNLRRETTYDEQGNIEHEYEFTYDARGYETGWTSVYHDSGTGEVERSYAVVEFGEDGYPYKNVYYNEDGTPSGTYDIMTYDDRGLEVERIKHHSGGGGSRFVYSYNDAGQCTRYDVYNLDGELTGYWIYQFDASGEATGAIHYDAEGNVTGTSVYN